MFKFIKNTCSKIFKNLDALTLTNIFAVTALFGDVLWWWRDYLVGDWTWHLAVIVILFVTSLVGTIIASIKHHKTKDDKYNDLLFRLRLHHMGHWHVHSRLSDSIDWVVQQSEDGFNALYQVNKTLIKRIEDLELAIAKNELDIIYRTTTEDTTEYNIALEKYHKLRYKHDKKQ